MPPKTATILLAASLAAALPGNGPAADLRPPALEPLPTGAIRPRGWLKEQLRIQAAGLTGHLDEFWPDIQRSGWIGGDAEGWERLPYWLDGAVPLAYQLGDTALRAKVERCMDYILTHQQEDGWLGPEQSATGQYKPRDPWPVFVAMKALTQYQEATGDPRVVPALERYLHTLAVQLEARPLFEWNRMRWQDGVLSVHWLHARTGEPWLLDLGSAMRRQGFDWMAHFARLPFTEKAGRWEHESHVVNNAMGVKAPGVWYRQSGEAADRQAASLALASLDRYHGQAAGHFSGDECFAGRMPSQGTETCAVVEYIFSAATLASILGEPVFAERLEALAYNALPAPFKPDMWARQYVHQANQPVAKISEERVYTTNGPDANVFGLETNYGCCTANMHQGWPKFTAHLWMALPGAGGLAAIAYAPCRVTATVKSVPVTVEVATEYPFGEEAALTVAVERPVRFPLQLRIPAWAGGATIAIGAEALAAPAPGTFHTVDRQWSGSTLVTLRLPMRVRLERRYNDAICVHRGPLVYSLRIGEEWRQVSGQTPHANWEVHPTTPWNYALLVDEAHPENSFEFAAQQRAGNPFDAAGAPVRLLARGRRLPAWALEKNAAAAPPPSPVTSTEPLETVTLIPYGAAKLRITEFPVLAE